MLTPGWVLCADTSSVSMTPGCVLCTDASSVSITYALGQAACLSTYPVCVIAAETSLQWTDAAAALERGMLGLNPPRSGMWPSFRHEDIALTF